MTKQSQLIFKAKIIEAGFKDYTAFAKALGVKPAVVHFWSKGASPRSSNLRKIKAITAGKIDANWFAGFDLFCQKEKEQSKKYDTTE
jgi:hypothetical protein